MRRRLTWAGLLGIAIVVAALYARDVLATPAGGFTGTTLAVGRFGDIDVSNHLLPPEFSSATHNGNVWMSWQKTKGLSDVFVQSNVWVPGGTTGWHSHPGHSLIVVTEGTVTVYDADDHKCRPHRYTKGMGFVDEGGDHAHIIRNEGTVDARTIAVQLVPAGAVRRIDVTDPGNCTF